MSATTGTQRSGRARRSALLTAATLLTLLATLGLGLGPALAQPNEGGDPANEADAPAESADPAPPDADAEGAGEGGDGPDAEAAAPSEGEPENADADAPEADPTDESIDRLMRQRQAPPAVAPTDSPAGEQAPAGQVEPDRSVLGVAPDAQQPELRREGEFIVNRRGHLRRSADGAHLLFVFEADDRESPEAPMILQPCRLLETMEDIVERRGEDVAFILSGQVHTYRGANYLLPTMMRIDVNRDDLE